MNCRRNEIGDAESALTAATFPWGESHRLATSHAIAAIMFLCLYWGSEPASLESACTQEADNAASKPANDAATKPTRHARPDREAFNAAQRRIELKRRDMLHFRFGANATYQAETLLKECPDLESDPVGYYTYTKWARHFAILGDNYELALYCSERLAKDFEESEAVLICEASQEIAKKTLSHAVARRLLDVADPVYVRLHRTYYFEAAATLCEAAISSARRVHDLEALEEWKRRRAYSKRILSLLEPNNWALARIKEKPNDPQAFRTLAAVTMEANHAWTAGLKQLAVGDPTTKPLVNADLKAPTDPSDQLELADDWWDWIQKQDPQEPWMPALPHYWYSKAFPRLQGDDQERAASRLKQLGVLTFVRLEKPPEIPTGSLHRYSPPAPRGSEKRSLSLTVDLSAPQPVTASVKPRLSAEEAARSRDAVAWVRSVKGAANIKLESGEFREIAPDTAAPDEPYEMVGVRFSSNSSALLMDADFVNLEGLRGLHSVNIFQAPNFTGTGFMHLAASATSLEYVILTQTGLDGSGMAQLRQFTRLKNLSINGSKISGPAFSALAAFKELRWLVIVATPGLDDQAFQFIGQSEHLNFLTLSGGAFTDAGVRQLAGLLNLEYLTLQGVPITDGGIEALRQLTKLRQLSLPDTQVTDAGIQRLDLGKLRSLDLQNTPIDGSCLTALTESPLVSLNLRRNKLRSIEGTAAIGKMELLETILLDDSTLPPQTLAHWTRLSELSQLWLGRSGLTDDELVHLTKLTKLKHLGLSATEVTDASIAHLTQLKQLQQLYLQETRVTQDGVKKLKDLLPKCMIHWTARK